MTTADPGRVPTRWTRQHGEWMPSFADLGVGCACPCHKDPDHCAICDNDYSNLCSSVSALTASASPPPVCVTCGGDGELVDCPPRCDGSHIADVPYPCPTCTDPAPEPPADAPW